MKTLDPEELARSLRFVSGRFEPEKLSLFAPVRDEMYFLSSFLDHHRSLGVEQFLMLDDGSVDETAAFLGQQSDCVVLNVPYEFGEEVRFKPKGRKLLKKRIGSILKNEIPKILLRDKFVLYLDADEFLFLPPGIQSIRPVIERLEASSNTSVCASVVEFFPGSISDIETNFVPHDLAGLLAEYPYFDATRMIALKPNLPAEIIGQSKTGTLVRDYCPVARRSRIRDLLGMSQKLPQPGRSPRLKTPIVFHSENSFRLGSHKAFPPPSSDILLTIGHFVFTSNLGAKINRALEWKSHRGMGSKYQQYQLLLDAMKLRNASFLGADSARFKNTSQFVDCGLMKW